MQNSYLLLTAVSYIEEHLKEDLSLADIAASCHSSLSGLHRSFSAGFGYSLKEYITKRRMSRAARELIDSDCSVTEIAYAYQYGSPEAFTRAFARIFNETPSVYRRKYRFHEIFPRITVEMEKEGEIGMKKVDISSFYDRLKELGGCYMICIDIRRFDLINKTHGYATGDLILAEAAKRIEQHIDDDMSCLRVGNDEFVVLTSHLDPVEAESLAERISGFYDADLGLQTGAISFGLRTAIAKLPQGEQLFVEMLKSFDQAVAEERAKEAQNGPQ